LFIRYVLQNQTVFVCIKLKNKPIFTKQGFSNSFVMHRSLAIKPQPRDSAHAFKDFLKDLKLQYLDFEYHFEREIFDYLRDTKLWHNQFVYIHHIKSGKFFHKGFENALGYQMDKLTADFFVRSIHPADLDMYFDISKALLSFVMQHSEHLVPFKSSFNINYRVQKQDGAYVSVLRQSTPFIKNSEGKVEAYISLCTDISDIADDYRVKWHIYGPKSEQFPYFLKQQTKGHEEEKLFSERELDILKLLGLGYSSTEIAEKLFISNNTVNTHRKNLMRKAHVNKTVDLLFYAKENGFI